MAIDFSARKGERYSMKKGSIIGLLLKMVYSVVQHVIRLRIERLRKSRSGFKCRDCRRAEKMQKILVRIWLCLKARSRVDGSRQHKTASPEALFEEFLCSSCDLFHFFLDTFR